MFIDIKTNKEVKNVFEVDWMIAKTILLLRHNGHKTLYCCSGHPHKNETTSQTYILFEYSKKTEKVLIKLISKLLSNDKFSNIDFTVSKDKYRGKRRIMFEIITAHDDFKIHQKIISKVNKKILKYLKEIM